MKKIKKLTLKKETIASLDNNQMRNLVGGFDADTNLKTYLGGCDFTATCPAGGGGGGGGYVGGGGPGSAVNCSQVCAGSGTCAGGATCAGYVWGYLC